MQRTPFFASVSISIAAFLLASTCTLAQAEPNFESIPEILRKPLLGNGLTMAQMNQGVLRLQMDKREVSELTYSSFIFHSICAQQWRNPAGFATAALTRVELFNADASQGHAFDARGDVCERLGKMGQSYRALITQNTVACAANACPAAR